MLRSLPTNPSLRFLKEEAKDLLKAQRNRDAACCPTLRRLHRFSRCADQEILSAEIGLQEVQFALAMDYGFSNWDHLAKAVALREHLLQRIHYWERFGPAEGFANTPEGKVQGLLADPEWLQLAEMEAKLGTLSEPCRQIRRQIARLEGCHESYMANIESILHMIATMTPGEVFDCRWPCPKRRAEAAAYVRALESWLGEGAALAREDALVRQVYQWLGDRTERKAELVGHMVAKLRQGSYQVPGETAGVYWESVESRIQHLEICNFNWPENVRIVLQEIAAGRQLAAWHVPDGFNAHGDIPDRSAVLQPMLAEVSAWIAGRQDGAGNWAGVLGEMTPEKRWLAACLCKNVTAQSQFPASAGA